MARPHPPHTHKADTAERGTLAEQEGAQFHALIQQIQKDHEIVASICGVSMLRRCVVVVNELRLEMWSSLVARYYGHALLLHVHMTTIAMC